MVFYSLAMSSSLTTTLWGEHCHPGRKTAQPEVLLAFYHPTPSVYIHTLLFCQTHHPLNSNLLTYLPWPGIMGNLAGHFLAFLAPAGLVTLNGPWILTYTLNWVELWRSLHVGVLSPQISTEIQGQRQYFIHSYTHRVLQIYTQAINESIHLFTNGWLRRVEKAQG